MIRISGRGIEDLGNTLSWTAAASILKNLDLNSALARDVDDDMTIWNSQLKTNHILADIYDILAAIHYVLIRFAGGKAQKPKPYPRPKDKKKNIRHFGKGAMKVDDLKKWLFRK